MVLRNRFMNRPNREKWIGFTIAPGPVALPGVLLAALLASLTACGKGAPQAPPPGPMPVSVIHVQSGNVRLSNEWVGTMDGYVNAQIQPQVTGYLLEQQQAALGEAQAPLALAKINLARDTPLAAE